MPRQTEIPGTEDPAKNPELELALDCWLEAKEEQKRAADATKIHHLSLLEAMANAGVDRYAFVDRTTGKKRHVVVARDPKAKTMNAPGGKGKRRDEEHETPGDRLDAANEALDNVMTAMDRDNVVEMRRVRRTKEHEKIADPFGSTRGLLEQAEAEQPKEE